VNVVGHRQPDDHWVDIPLPGEDIVAREQPQDMQYNDMESYDGVHYHPLPRAVSSMCLGIHLRSR
jgi:hypothetical protein